MPATQFFLMLKSARQLQNQERLALTHIARAPSLTWEGYLKLVDMYSGASGIDIPVEQTTNQAEKIDQEQARAAVMSAFSKDKRIH